MEQVVTSVYRWVQDKWQQWQANFNCTTPPNRYLRYIHDLYLMVPLYPTLALFWRCYILKRQRQSSEKCRSDSALWIFFSQNADAVECWTLVLELQETRQQIPTTWISPFKSRFTRICHVIVVGSADKSRWSGDGWSSELLSCWNNPIWNILGRNSSQMFPV